MTTPRTDDDAIRRENRALRLALNRLYSTVNRLRILAHDAGLSEFRINTQQSTEEVAHDLIVEARKVGRFLALVEAARVDYPDDAELRGLRVDPQPPPATQLSASRAEEPPPEARSSPRTDGPKRHDSSDHLACFGGDLFVAADVVVRSKGVEVVVMNPTAPKEAELTRRTPVGELLGMASGNRAFWARVTDHELQNTSGRKAFHINFKFDAPRTGWDQEVAVGDGTRTYSADDIAELRARRILMVPSPRVPEPYGQTLEMMVRGLKTRVEVPRSPLPMYLRQIDPADDDAWAAVRLGLLYHLVLSNCVETVDRLALDVVGGRLAGISFEGTRHKMYSNVDPTRIKVEGPVALT